MAARRQAGAPSGKQGQGHRVTKRQAGGWTEVKHWHTVGPAWLHAAWAPTVDVGELRSEPTKDFLYTHFPGESGRKWTRFRACSVSQMQIVIKNKFLEMYKKTHRQICTNVKNRLQKGRLNIWFLDKVLFICSVFCAIYLYLYLLFYAR